MLEAEGPMQTADIQSRDVFDYRLTIINNGNCRWVDYVNMKVPDPLQAREFSCVLEGPQWYQ